MIEDILQYQNNEEEKRFRRRALFVFLMHIFLIILGLIKFFEILRRFLCLIA